MAREEISFLLVQPDEILLHIIYLLCGGDSDNSLLSFMITCRRICELMKKSECVRRRRIHLFLKTIPRQKRLLFDVFSNKKKMDCDLYSISKALMKEEEMIDDFYSTEKSPPSPKTISISSHLHLHSHMGQSHTLHLCREVDKMIQMEGDTSIIALSPIRIGRYDPSLFSTKNWNTVIVGGGNSSSSSGNRERDRLLLRLLRSNREKYEIGMAVTREPHLLLSLGKVIPSTLLFDLYDREKMEEITTHLSRGRTWMDQSDGTMHPPSFMVLDNCLNDRNIAREKFMNKLCYTNRFYELSNFLLVDEGFSKISRSKLSQLDYLFIFPEVGYSEEDKLSMWWCIKNESLSKDLFSKILDVCIRSGNSTNCLVLDLRKSHLQGHANEEEWIYFYDIDDGEDENYDLMCDETYWKMDTIFRLG